VQIELVPDLEHCIETVARKKHAELTQVLLGSETCDTEVEEKLETIRLFLETADFKRLRSESEKLLVEGKTVRFTVYFKNNAAGYQMLIS